VYGSGGAGVFAVTVQWIVPTAGGGEFWYLLRLRAGVPALLRRLPVGHAAGPGPTAVALSPDGSTIAMAFTYRTSPPHPQPLTLYRVATGAVLRTWTVTSGIISAADPMANGDLGREAGNIGMRWTADGRGLAFAFHANTAPGKDGYGYDRMASIRLLDTTAPGGDLIANSHELTSASPQYNPGNGAGTQCLASNGWSLSSDGRAVTCAAEWTSPGAQPPASPRAAACASPPGGASAIPQQRNLGFWRQFSLPGGAGADTVYGVCVGGSIQLDWASPDGTTVLGSLAGPGHSSFGLFSHDAFHELPPPPAGVPSALIAW
jgi:hypothetical protein